MVEKWATKDAVPIFSVLLDICPTDDHHVFEHGSAATECPKCGIQRDSARQMMVGGISDVIKQMYKVPELAAVSPLSLSLSLSLYLSLFLSLSFLCIMFWWCIYIYIYIYIYVFMNTQALRYPLNRTADDLGDGNCSIYLFIFSNFFLSFTDQGLIKS